MRTLPVVLILFQMSSFFEGALGIQFRESNSSVCQNGMCIKKCCPEDHFVVRSKFMRKECKSKFFLPEGSKLENITLPVYDYYLEKTGLRAEDVFFFEENAFADKNFTNKVYEALSTGFNAYLTETGTVYMENPNAFQRWLPLKPVDFCVDYLFLKKTNTTRLGIWGNFGEQAMAQGNKFYTIGMIVSCVFLVVVLVVYCLLSELRNLGGLILMAYDLSLLFAFIFLMILQMPNHSSKKCVNYSMTVYFFFLATFCWMNIMSYDIWWTFRGYAKARPIHRRGEKFKFAMYSLYAWGLPLGMTIGLYVLNTVDMSHMPWFITPKIPKQGCFLESGEKLVYLYTPMLIMILLNWLFFLMTAFNIWRLSRGTAVLDSAAAGTPDARRSNRRRLMIYLKLSVLMGLNWLLEVVSSFKPDLSIWYLTDSFNLLLGFGIFLIFVCKKKILKKLIKKFRSCRKPSWKPSFSRSRSSSSTTESSIISQETPLQICINPKGP